MAVPGKTFDVEVEGIGAFTFRKRTMADQIWVESEAYRMAGGGPESCPGGYSSAIRLAALQRFTVAAPNGWDLSDADPLDMEAWDRVMQVSEAHREAEDRFRGRAAPNGKGVGPAGKPDLGV